MIDCEMTIEAGKLPFIVRLKIIINTTYQDPSEVANDQIETIVTDENDDEMKALNRKVH